jgi:hypothetical protein
MNNKETKGIKQDLSEFISEAYRIVEEASARNIHLRILGALAVYIHIKDDHYCIDLLNKIGRLDEKTLFTDLDLIGYSCQRKEVAKLMKNLGYIPDRMINSMFGNKRMIFYHPNNYYHVDIFYDKLEFSHDVIFGSDPINGRLKLDYPTISLTDLVLEKLQINKINKKDLVDLLLIFLSHDISTNDNEKEFINASYIADILSDDWGFWYDATNNLNNLKNFATEIFSTYQVDENYVKKFNERINALLKIIEERPKTKKWIKRSKDGTNKIWYREVEEIIR